MRKKFISKLECFILKNHNLSSLITISEVYGSYLTSNNIGIYSANNIENHIIKCIEDQCAFYDDGSNKKDCLHIISCALDTGGHTRLLERVAGFHEEKTDLLISRLIQPASKTRLVKKFDKIHYLSSSSVEEKINQLILIISKYNRVILHIDPNDISIVVACGFVKKNTNLKVFFINHADHCFSYGFSICDAILNVSTFGELINQKRNHSGFSSFLGIPCDTSTSLKSDIIFQSQLTQPSRLFVMAGNLCKIKNTYHTDISGISIIKKVLSEFKKDHVLVVGLNWWGDWKWCLLKLRYFNRLEMLSSLPYESYLLATRGADFFLDTHPMPGGTALVEQFLKGSSVTGLKSPIQGYSGIEICKFDTISQLIQFLAARKPRAIDDQEMLIKRVLDVHGLKAVSYRYLKCIYEMEASENPINNQLKWSGDTEFFLIPNIGKIKLTMGDIKKIIVHSPMIFLMYSPYFSYLSMIIAFLRGRLNRVPVLVSRWF